MDTPTLASHFAGPVLTPSIQMKGLFSKKPNLSMMSAFYSGLAVYQQGAVLGYARNSQMETLATLFATSGNEKDACDALIEASKEDVAEYGRPDNFIDFFTSTCAKQFASFRNLDAIKEMSKEQVRLGIALGWIDYWFLAGVGVGLAFPELVKTMWHNGYEAVDPESWEQARRAGLDIPERQTPLPLEEMEKVVLSQAAEYAHQYFPEVIGPLRLM